MTPRTQRSDIRRIGRYWRVRFPGGRFLLFKHQAAAKHAATLDMAQATENAACVGMDVGRLVRTRHLVDSRDPPRLFFVIGGEEVEASKRTDVIVLIFMDHAEQGYPVGRPRCVDCSGRLHVKGACGEWIEVKVLERRLALGTGCAHPDDGLRRCSECGSLFTDTRHGWGWRPLDAYVPPVRPSTLDTLSQMACVSGILGVLALIYLWDLTPLGWWVIPVAAVWFVSCMAATGWLEDLSHEWDIPDSALAGARRMADIQNRAPTTSFGVKRAR